MQVCVCVSMGGARQATLACGLASGAREILPARRCLTTNAAEPLAFPCESAYVGWNRRARQGERRGARNEGEGGKVRGQGLRIAAQPPSF